MEVVSQQGKEIIKTALRCLLREAMTLKRHDDKVAQAGMYPAAFIPGGEASQRPGAGGGAATCLAYRWASPLFLEGRGWGWGQGGAEKAEMGRTALGVSAH